jgi:hypothetical protein
MNTAQLKATRAIGTKTVGYTHTLRFTRLFTSGHLEGLTHDDVMGFCSAADCDEWVATINASKKLSYRIVSWTIEVAS